MKTNVEEMLLKAAELERQAAMLSAYGAHRLADLKFEQAADLRLQANA